MDASTLRNRRRFLEGVGVGGGLLLAGCTERLGGAPPDDLQEGASDTETGSGASGVAAAVAAIDQQAMREEQAAVREDVQNGEMNREEARQRMAELQQQYVTDGMNSLVETVEGTDGATVAKRYETLGAVSLTGEADAILGLLTADTVNALVPVSAVEAQVATQGQGTPQA